MMFALALTLILPLLAEDLPGSQPIAEDPQQTIDRTRTEERSLLSALREIDRELQGMAVEMESLLEQRQEQEKRQAALQAELDAANGALDAHRAAIAERVQALYWLNRRGLARIIFGAEDPYDLRRRSQYLLAIIAADAQRFEAFNEAVRQKALALTAVNEGMAALQSLGAEIQLQEAALREQRDRKRVLLTDIRGERALAVQMLREMRVAQQRFDGRMTAQSSGPINGRGCGDPNRFRSFSGKLSWPLQGPIVRGFGPYFDANGNRNRNDGIDIAAAYGTPVAAVYPGTVDIAESVRAYGDTVVIAHGDYKTVYTHLSRIRVRRDQSVCPGDIIGNVGTTGFTDDEQPSLGFQVRYNGQPQDPLLWLQR